MSETKTAETWAVVDEAGVIHEVDVSEGRSGSPPWVAHVADGTARRSHASARDAVVLVAQECGWAVVEVLAPGQVSAAQLRAVAQAAATLVLWHDANTPDGDLNDADGRLWTMIDALRAAGYEMPTGTPTGPTRDELTAEVAHLEARRGALLAEVDRLRALRLPGGAQ